TVTAPASTIATARLLARALMDSPLVGFTSRLHAISRKDAALHADWQLTQHSWPPMLGCGAKRRDGYGDYSGFDRGADHRGRRRHLLLGHRTLRAGSQAGEPAQIACHSRLPRRNRAEAARADVLASALSRCCRSHPPEVIAL